MESFDDILSEIIQKNEDSPKTVEAFAEKIDLSDAQLSRVKSGKSKLSDNVINKIYDYFAKSNKKYANELKERLEKIKSESKNKSDINVELYPPKSIAVQELEKLFQTLSQEGTLLIIDYRDFPISLTSFKELIEATVSAVKAGLNVCYCQSFGNRNSLVKKKNTISEKSLKTNISLIESADEIINAYDYLSRLAVKVNKIYCAVKERLVDEEKNRVVLYEASYSQNEKDSDAIPTIVACGISSRLFYADYKDTNNESKTKIYEWISSQNDNHYFIERSNATLNFNAVKMQFNPMPAYWKKYGKLPKDNKELEKAYEEFGLGKIFEGESEPIKWKVWEETQD
jgi:transcriptional regulator with XRE-family HTH domain